MNIIDYSRRENITIAEAMERIAQRENEINQAMQALKNKSLDDVKQALETLITCLPTLASKHTSKHFQNQTANLVDRLESYRIYF